jgi:hypothetical protein
MEKDKGSTTGIVTATVNIAWKKQGEQGPRFQFKNIFTSKFGGKIGVLLVFAKIGS